MVPPSTVARVFSEVSFARDSTRITSSAVALSAEYIRLFVLEAILRANAQRLSEEKPTEIDGIDNTENIDTLDALETHDQFPDSYDDIDEEDRGLGVSTQMPPATDANDALTTRHLAAISGLLVMDF